jgi:hypothetical protein
MKDIPFYKREIKRPPEGRMTIAYGNFKISPEIEIRFRVSAYYSKKDDLKFTYNNNVRIWEFDHRCDERMYPPIYNSICEGCKKKFPPFQTLITAIRLQLFTDSSNLAVKYASYITI